MENRIRVRDFHPGDRTAFRKLNEEWITRHFALEVNDRRLFADPEGEILAHGGRILMLDDDGVPIGCCALIHRDNETFEVAKMAVTESQQGRGLGTLLLQHCIDQAKASGKRRLFLETNTKLQAAVALYRKLGFIGLPAEACPPSHYARVDLMMELHL